MIERDIAQDNLDAAGGFSSGPPGAKCPCKKPKRLHVGVFFDGTGNNFGRLLRFKNTAGRWRSWAMPMELLRGDGSDLRGELLAMGLEIDPAARNTLARYLQERAPFKRIRLKGARSCR